MQFKQSSISPKTLQKIQSIHNISRIEFVQWEFFFQGWFWGDTMQQCFGIGTGEAGTFKTVAEGMMEIPAEWNDSMGEQTTETETDMRHERENTQKMANSLSPLQKVQTTESLYYLNACLLWGRTERETITCEASSYYLSCAATSTPLASLRPIVCVRVLRLMSLHH